VKIRLTVIVDRKTIPAERPENAGHEWRFGAQKAAVDFASRKLGPFAQCGDLAGLFGKAFPRPTVLLDVAPIDACRTTEIRIHIEDKGNEVFGQRIKRPAAGLTAGRIESKSVAHAWEKPIEPPGRLLGEIVVERTKQTEAREPRQLVRRQIKEIRRFAGGDHRFELGARRFALAGIDSLDVDFRVLAFVRGADVGDDLVLRRRPPVKYRQRYRASGSFGSSFENARADVEERPSHDDERQARE
jgi:hypothetical protein